MIPPTDSAQDWLDSARIWGKSAEKKEWPVLRGITRVALIAIGVALFCALVTPH